MIGSPAPRMLRLTAQYADLWNGYLRRAPATASSGVAAAARAVDAACARSAATRRRWAAPPACRSSIRAGRSARRGAVPPFSGTPEELAEELRAYAREGVCHVQIWLEPMLPSGIEAFQPVLELLDRGVVHRT